MDKYNIKNSPKYPPYITQLKDLNEKDKKKFLEHMLKLIF